jgi:hypothetical protein
VTVKECSGTDRAFALDGPNSSPRASPTSAPTRRAPRAAKLHAAPIVITPMWAEHRRDDDRVSVAHEDVEQHAYALTRNGSTIATRHFTAPVL